MSSYALVFEVFGIPISDQMELDCLTYARLQRDAICGKLIKTPEGKDYLDKCWTLQQTKSDKKKLREQFG